MKKILFLAMAVLPVVFSSCSEDENSEEFKTREVSVIELESGTGTWSNNINNGFYIGFKDGNITYSDLSDDSSGIHFCTYTLSGNTIIITDRNGDEYSLDISMMEYDGKEELAISGTNEAPYEFQKGSFTRSQFSLFR